MAATGPGRVARKSTVVLSDPLLPSQWHNVGTPAVDINITEAWGYFTGLGIKFGVYDDGIDKAHVDLAANYDAVAACDASMASSTIPPFTIRAMRMAQPLRG